MSYDHPKIIQVKQLHAKLMDVLDNKRVVTSEELSTEINEYIDLWSECNKLSLEELYIKPKGRG